MRFSISTSSARAARGPAGRERRAPRRRSPWLFPLELCLLFASLMLFDTGLERLLARARPSDYVAFIDSRAAFDAKADYKMIAVGDSLIADAFVPKIFEDRTGLKSFNFGVYNSSPFEWLHLTNDLLARGAHPSHLIIGVNPRMFDPPISAGVHTFDFLATWPARLRMLTEARSADSIFASVRHRYLIKVALRHAVTGKTGLPLRQVTEIDNGYLRSESFSTLSPHEAITSYPPLSTSSGVKGQHDAFERLLRLLVAQGIVPVIVQPPTHPVLQRALEKQPAYLAFGEKLATIADRYGALRFNFAALPEVESLSDEDFLDLEHVDGSGARSFSNILGGWFAAHAEPEAATAGAGQGVRRDAFAN